MNNAAAGIFKQWMSHESEECMRDVAHKQVPSRNMINPY